MPRTVRLSLRVRMMVVAVAGSMQFWRPARRCTAGLGAESADIGWDSTTLQEWSSTLHDRNTRRSRL